MKNQVTDQHIVDSFTNSLSKFEKIMIEYNTTDNMLYIYLSDEACDENCTCSEESLNDISSAYLDLGQFRENMIYMFERFSKLSSFEKTFEEFIEESIKLFAINVSEQICNVRCVTEIHNELKKELDKYYNNENELFDKLPRKTQFIITPENLNDKTSDSIQELIDDIAKINDCEGESFEYQIVNDHALKVYIKEVVVGDFEKQESASFGKLLTNNMKYSREVEYDDLKPIMISQLDKSYEKSICGKVTTYESDMNLMNNHERYNELKASGEAQLLMMYSTDTNLLASVLTCNEVLETMSNVLKEDFDIIFRPFGLTSIVLPKSTQGELSETSKQHVESMKSVEHIQISYDYENKTYELETYIGEM